MHFNRGITARLAIAIAPLAILSAEAAQDFVRGIPVNPQREAYYGDLHLHTSYSFDAHLLLDAQVDPDGAYRFARGEAGKYLGEEVKRSSPRLDFMAVTDHAELIGVASALPKGPWPRGWPSRPVPLPGVDTEAIGHSAWQRVIAAANRHYRPGKFTTFIGYEWTSQSEGGAIHRNVIFRGDKAPHPFSSLDSTKPEDLWSFLESIRKQGYEALAIPHNPNTGNGLTFDWVDSDGRAIDQRYAERRAFNEPLVEIVQNKGQSETRPTLSPNDEYANFEVLDRAAIRKGVSGKAEGSYVRDGLGRGLVIAQGAGEVNPFKYGFVGGSDFHNGLSESAERAYGGSLDAIEPTKKMLDKIAQLPARWPPANIRYELGSAGLTGVWAEQNTRESIYAALRRKETFATSGTRLKFRFFGGWDFHNSQLKKRDWVTECYRAGVPMGGDLPPQPAAGQAPRFALWAVKDPNGANLDRMQVVKVWLEGGKHVEKVYDVALSSGPNIDLKTGRAPAVGSTVNLQRATYSNTIGSIHLSTVWQDPQFDPKVSAAYYLRVLEIPTPRWSTIMAVKGGQPLPEGVPATVQERGWSSPIWYTPSRIRVSEEGRPFQLSVRTLTGGS